MKYLSVVGRYNGASLVADRHETHHIKLALTKYSNSILGSSGMVVPQPRKKPRISGLFAMLRVMLGNFAVLECACQFIATV